MGVRSSCVSGCLVALYYKVEGDLKAWTISLFIQYMTVSPDETLQNREPFLYDIETQAYDYGTKFSVK